jgi:hypothetical protein
VIAPPIAKEQLGCIPFRTSTVARISTLGNRYFGARNPMPSPEFSLGLVRTSSTRPSVRDSIHWKRGEGIGSAITRSGEALSQGNTIDTVKAATCHRSPLKPAPDVQVTRRPRVVTFDI